MDGRFRWSDEKNATRLQRYGIEFDEVLVALGEGRSLGVRPHPNLVRYPRQQQLLIVIENYVWVVPFVQEGAAYSS